MHNDYFTLRTWTSQECLVLSCQCCELSFATVADSFQYIGDRTVLSCLRCERIIWEQDKTQFTPHFETGQNFQNFQSQTVLTCLQISSQREHGQDKTVVSCPCSRCELAIRVIDMHCRPCQAVTPRAPVPTTLICRHLPSSWVVQRHTASSLPSSQKSQMSLNQAEILKNWRSCHLCCHQVFKVSCVFYLLCASNFVRSHLAIDICPSVCPTSVCLSVCLTRVLWQNEST